MGASQHFVLKVDLLEAGKMSECKDCHHSLTRAELFSASLHLQLSLGVPGMQGSVSIKVVQGTNSCHGQLRLTDACGEQSPARVATVAQIAKHV